MALVSLSAECADLKRPRLYNRLVAAAVPAAALAALVQQGECDAADREIGEKAVRQLVKFQPTPGCGHPNADSLPAVAIYTLRLNRPEEFHRLRSNGHG